MRRSQTSILWITAAILATLALLGWGLEREIDQEITTSLANARKQIAALITIRRDARKAHVAMLERWILSTDERAPPTDNLSNYLDGVQRSMAKFAEKSNPTADADEAVSALKRDVGSWSERLAKASMASEGPKSAPELRALHEQVDIDVERLIDRHLQARASIEQRVATLQACRQAVQLITIAGALVTLMLAARRWRKQQAAEAQFHVSEQSRMELRRMAASLAHEINNQLGVLQNTIALLGKKLPGDEVLAFQQESVDNMKQMSSDFLAFGTAGSGPIERIDLVQLLQHVSHPFADRVDVPLNDPVWIEADRAALGRAFLNVIKNGIEAGGHVEVGIERLPDGVRVTCKDAGPGVAPEHLSSVGEPFFTTKARGTGLGLALVRQIMGRHGGRFSLQNLPSGKGAVAELWFSR